MGNLSPILSIIIPLFNTERYIEECLDSILKGNEDCTELEVIVVDDGSTDNSVTIVKSYANRYSCLKLVQQNNNGVSIARKKGVEAARGSYVWFVDSDDYLVPGASQIILSHLSDNPGINTVFAPVLLRDDETSKEWVKPFAPFSTAVLDGRQFMQKQPVSVCPVQFVFEKQLFSNKWIYFPEHLRHEDEYFCRVLQYFSKKMLMLNEPLYIYRQWRGSFMNSGAIKSLYDMVEVYKHLSAFVEEGAEPEDHDWLCKDILSFLLGTHFWHRDILQTNGFMEFRQKNLSFIKKEFSANKCSLSFKERAIDQLMLFSPTLFQFILGAKQSFKS